MLVNKKTIAKIPNMIAARPDMFFVKYRIATTKANTVLMTLSIVPMFCFIAVPPFNYLPNAELTGGMTQLGRLDA
jgi:hypothetical protein